MGKKFRREWDIRVRKEDGVEDEGKWKGVERRE